MPIKYSNYEMPQKNIRFDSFNRNWAQLNSFLQNYIEKNGYARFVLWADLVIENSCPITSFTNIVGIVGDVTIRCPKFESLGQLEFIKGSLILHRNKGIQSLDRLSEIEGNFICTGTALQTFGDLKIVKGAMKLVDNNQLNNIERLERVEGSLELVNSPIESLGSLKYLGGKVKIGKTLLEKGCLSGIQVEGKIRFIEAFEEYSIVIPYHFFNNDWDSLQSYLNKIGNPLYALHGNIELAARTDLNSLGKLIEVKGDLTIRSTTLESLGELKVVQGNLIIMYNKYLKSLGNLETVDGNLSLSTSFIESLGNLKTVRKLIYIRNSMLTQSNFNKVNFVGFSFKGPPHFSKIEDLFPVVIKVG
jgi:hypothetical protein